MSRATPPLSAATSSLLRGFPARPSAALSPHTIRSYRDALLLLASVRRARRAPPDRAPGRSPTSPPSASPGSWLPGSGAAQRHRDAQCPARRDPRLRAVHGVPPPRAARLAAADHRHAVQARRASRRRSSIWNAPRSTRCCKSIDRTTPLGRRDYALFALMFNTGARVQEVLDLRVRDVRLDAPCQVRLHGKGSKVRLCPMWPATARLLRELIGRADHAPRRSGRRARLHQCARAHR